MHYTCRSDKWIPSRRATGSGAAKGSEASDGSPAPPERRGDSEAADGGSGGCEGGKQLQLWNSADLSNVD